MMKKLTFFTLIFSLCLPMAAHSDDELPSKPIDTANNAEVAKAAVEDAKARWEEYKAKLLQGFDPANFDKNIAEEIEAKKQAGISFIKDPNALLNQVAPSVADKLKGESSSAVKEEVRDKYSLKEDEGLEAATVRNKAINAELIETSAALFAKAVVLRQRLNNEEKTDPDLDTIESAMRTNTALMVQSLRRWNEALKVQAHISNYKNFLENKNFKVDKEDEE